MSENPAEPLKERVRRMLDHCEISNVRVLEFAARRLEEHGDATTAHFSSETSYLVNDQAFRNRYIWNAELVDDAERPVAELGATLVVDYELHDGFEPDTEAADNIASTTGFFAAYPYVRELFQSATSRLQFDPMVLGMLLAGSTRPRGVTITRASDQDQPVGNAIE